MPLPTAFVQLGRYAPDGRFEAGLKQVAREVAGGATLEAALRRAALVDEASLELIAAAEASGSLERVLAALAAHREAVRTLQWQALLSSLWPGYLVGLLVFLGPLVRASGSGAQTSQGLFLAWVAGVVPGVLGLALMATLLVLWPVIVSASGLEVQWDRLALRLPGVGSALRSLAASRSLMTLGLALGAGVEVAKAVRVALLASGRASLQRAAESAVQRVRSGGTLFDALTGMELFDRAVLGQLAVAEQTGTLEETLARLGPQLHESMSRSVRLLILAVTGLIAAGALLIIVRSLLGAVFGPLKAYFDAIGSGRLPGESP